mgnify:CR=1 FL=1
MTRILRLTLLAIILATPLAAQETLCGGAGAGGQWIGGSESASDITTASTFGEQMALVLNDNRYVGLFSLSAPTAVRIEAAGRGNGDPILSLLGPDGSEIGNDDDSGGNGASRLEVDLEPGRYCAVVTSFEGAPMTAFVRVGRTDMAALTPGTDDAPDTPDRPAAIADGSCDTAQDLGTLGDTPISLTGSARDVPYARFTLDSATAISITANNPDADPTLEVRDDTGAVIGENDDADGLNSRIDLSAPVPAGTYCIVLGAISDVTLPIDVGVGVYDPAAALAALYARGEAAPPLDGSVAVTDLGALSNRLRKDVQADGNTTWFSLTIDAPGLLLVEALAAGGNGDPWLVLYDDLGRQIAQNDDNGSGTDSLMTARVLPGQYLIGLKQVQDMTGFVRLVLERYIPAP